MQHEDAAHARAPRILRPGETARADRHEIDDELDAQHHRDHLDAAHDLRQRELPCRIVGMILGQHERDRADEDAVREREDERDHRVFADEADLTVFSLTAPPMRPLRQ